VEDLISGHPKCSKKKPRTAGAGNSGREGRWS